MLLKRHFEVLPDRQRLEDPRHLELDRNAPPDALERAHLRDVCPVEADGPGIRRMLAQQQTEKARLAGTVRTDQAVHRAGLEREVDAVRHNHAAEGLAQPAHPEDLAHRPVLPNSRPIRFIAAITSPCGAASTVISRRTPITTSAYWLP